MLTALILECLIVVAATIALTAAGYSTLPARVALHLNADGSPGQAIAPRWMIYFIPFAQLFCGYVITSVGFALANHAPNTHGSLRGLLVSAPCILAALGRGQLQLMDANRTEHSLSMASFWAFMIVFIGLGMAASFLL